MEKIFFLVAVIIVLAGCQSPHGTPAKKTENFTAIDSLITRQISEQHIAGAVIRIQQGDSVWLRKAYGYARGYDYNFKKLNNPEKMTPEHLFDLASLTKVCGTTFGIMMLVDEGKIKLDDPISTWLSEFSSGEKEQITVRHLLTHSAGLYQWKPTYYYASNKQEQYQYISTLPLKYPVGEGRHYSDLGFMLLGHIIEEISGQSLDDFLDERIYQPLNLKHTTFNPYKKDFEKIAATSHGNPFEHHMVYDDDFGYDVDADTLSWNGWRDYTLTGEVNDGNAWYAAGGVAGHAGLFSNVDDLQKLMTLLLKKGSYKGKELISPSVIDTFITKNKYNNGLGWAMDPEVISTESGPKGTFGHTGFTGTNIVVIPAYNISIILLTNRQNVKPQQDGYYFNLNGVRQNIFDTVLNMQKHKKGL